MCANVQALGIADWHYRNMPTKDSESTWPPGEGGKAEEGVVQGEVCVHSVSVLLFTVSFL